MGSTVPEIWFYVLWLIGAYLLGSVSPGDVVAKTAGVDIRTVGTRNPGAANIYTEVGPWQGIAVFVLDTATGAVATFPLYLLAVPAWIRLLAVMAVLGGHIFPLYWRFKGGIGGAVSMGTSLGLLPLGALIAAPVTALVLGLTRNAIYAVWSFFGVTLVAGGVLHKDLVGVVGVLLAITIPTIKWLLQHHIRHIADLRKTLGI